MSQRYRFFVLYISLFCLSAIYPQSANVNLLANIDNYPFNGYSDCWGYVAPDGREYALQGVNGGVMIVDVSNARMNEVDFVPWVVQSWYDIKTYQNYMYVSSEGRSSVLIVDLAPLPNAVTVVDSISGLPSQPHNIFIDTSAAILYVVEDFNPNQPVSLYDISTPTSPVFLSSLGPGLGTDAHDVFARNGRLFVAEGGNPTIGVFDVSDPGSPALLQRVNVPVAGYVHNVWVSDDGNYMASTEETAGKTVKIWDIQDLNNVSLIGEYLGDSQLAHNVFWVGDYLYLSHYESGIKVVDVTDPTNPVEVAFYDTYPAGDNSNFNGSWGMYPFGLNGKIFAGDQTTGLYVLEFDSVFAGAVNGTVTDETNTAIADVVLEFVEARKTLVSDTLGGYEFQSFGGDHTIIASRLGYFPDTLQLSIPEGGNVQFDIVLNTNLADLALSVDSLTAILPMDTVATLQFVIQNEGPGGRLDYALDDINGPLNSGLRYPVSRSYDLSEIPAGLMTGSAGHMTALSGAFQATGDTVVIDSLGDQAFGTTGDLVGVYVTRSATSMTLEFEFAEAVETDSAALLFSLDTDFDITTGAFPGSFGLLAPGQTTGSEFDVFITLPTLPIAAGNSYYIWPGSNQQPAAQPTHTGIASVLNNIVSITIPYSAIGNDDGNMAIAGFAGHLDPVLVNFVSLDYFPNAGSGTIGIDPQGDLPWLSLSRDNGSLGGGESDTITVTFDTHNLSPDDVLSGIVAVYTNDPDETVTAIPVQLFVQPLGIDDPGAMVERFELKQNYPNPFNPQTTIEFYLPRASVVLLEIFDIVGRRVVAPQHAAPLQAGAHKFIWNGSNSRGNPVSSGTYFYRLTAGDYQQTRRMILLR